MGRSAITRRGSTLRVDCNLTRNVHEMERNDKQTDSIASEPWDVGDPVLVACASFSLLSMKPPLNGSRRRKHPQRLSISLSPVTLEFLRQSKVGVDGQAIPTRGGPFPIIASNAVALPGSRHESHRFRASRNSPRCFSSCRIHVRCR